VKCHLGVVADSSSRRALEGVFDAIVANNLSQPMVYMHHDYTARNLMVCDPNPGVLDFQDAMNGPITYDVASLLWSSTRDWPEERVRGWTTQYWEKAQSMGLPVQDSVDEFWQALTWTAVQRQLKMLGVFARLKYRDGKPQYLENSPRVLRRIRAFAADSSALARLVEIVDALADTAAARRREREASPSSKPTSPTG
jgi:aminoglycoside/choline kinase family phosphotransferase